ncbi:MAG: LPS kinase Kdo/WaaP [Prevotellaceae bacterium]|nr:LPS kinase Kdo/WaaP [Prevotellaceae bacterium]
MEKRRAVCVLMAPGEAALRPFLETLPQVFAVSGELLFRGRNELRCFCVDGRNLVVKRFGRHNVAVRLLGVFGRSKARKSYDNAIRLVQLGVQTPKPVACVELRSFCGLATDTFYVCDYVSWPALGEGLHETGYFNRELTTAFAHFMVGIHAKGVEHCDLNATNVRFRMKSDGYAFMLIDLNRMRFHRNSCGLSSREGFANLTRFSCCSEMFVCFLREYIAVRGLPVSKLAEALSVKHRHDFWWDVRKFFKRLANGWH